MKIVFSTTHTLRQETGMQLWKMGQHFMAVKGRATYQLTTNGEADDLSSAVEGAIAAITTIVESDHPRQGIRVTKVEAEEMVGSHGNN
jgi:hypothetical protein